MPDVAALIAEIRSGRAAGTLESSVLDFKVEKDSFKESAYDLAEACVCFANTAGGTIIVGVRDHPGGDEAVVGTALERDALRSAIYDKTHHRTLRSTQGRRDPDHRL